MVNISHFEHSEGGIKGTYFFSGEVMFGWVCAEVVTCSFIMAIIVSIVIFIICIDRIHTESATM